MRRSEFGAGEHADAMAATVPLHPVRLNPVEGSADQPNKKVFVSKSMLNIVELPSIALIREKIEKQGDT